MAARISGYTTTTAVLGSSKIMKVRQWSCYSEPSETYFEVRARIETTRDQVQTIANKFSATIEALLAAPDYTDVTWSQDVTPGGNLVSIYTVYWHIPEKDESGFVEVPAGQFTIDHVAQLVLEDSGPGTFLLA